MTAKKIAYTHIILNSLWSACKHSTHFLFLKKIYIITDDTEPNLYSAAMSKVLTFLAMKEIRKPMPLAGARGWRGVHGDAPCPGAGLQAHVCRSLRGAAEPRALGIHACGTQTRRHLVRFHGHEDDNEDNDDDK